VSVCVCLQFPCIYIRKVR